MPFSSPINSTVLRTVMVLLLLQMVTAQKKCKANEYLDKDGNCKKCSSVLFGCSTCVYTKGQLQCTSCKSPTCLNRQHNQCRDGPQHCQYCDWGYPVYCKQCRPYFSVLSNGQCKRLCDSLGCVDCPANASICQKCASGYVKLANHTCRRICSVNHCEYCPYDVNECVGCVKGFNVQPDKKCQQNCDSINCFRCHNKPSECNQCQPGFYLSHNTCLPCVIPNCVSCPFASYDCRKCASGFILRPNKTCKKEICTVPNCDECPDDASKCTKCAYGFKLKAKMGKDGQGMKRIKDYTSIQNRVGEYFKSKKTIKVARYAECVSQMELRRSQAYKNTIWNRFFGRGNSFKAAY